MMLFDDKLVRYGPQENIWRTLGSTFQILVSRRKRHSIRPAALAAQGKRSMRVIHVERRCVDTHRYPMSLGKRREILPSLQMNHFVESLVKHAIKCYAQNAMAVTQRTMAWKTARLSWLKWAPTPPSQFQKTSFRSPSGQ